MRKPLHCFVFLCCLFIGGILPELMPQPKLEPLVESRPLGWPLGYVSNAIPVTCMPGEIYRRRAGVDVYVCTAPNQWSQIRSQPIKEHSLEAE